MDYRTDNLPGSPPAPVEKDSIAEICERIARERDALKATLAEHKAAIREWREAMAATGEGPPMDATKAYEGRAALTRRLIAAEARLRELSQDNAQAAVVQTSS